jgi:hypothetical protein
MPALVKNPFIALHAIDLIEAYKLAYENAGYTVVTSKSSPGILYDNVLFAKSKDPRKYIASKFTFRNDERCEYSCFESKSMIEPEGCSDSRNSALSAYDADSRKVESMIPLVTPSEESSRAAYYKGISLEKVMDVYEESYRGAGFDVKRHTEGALAPYLGIIIIMPGSSYQIELQQNFSSKIGSIGAAVHASWRIRQMPDFPTIQNRNVYFSRFRECGLKAQNAIKAKIGGFAIKDEEYDEQPPKKKIYRSELEWKMDELKRR